MKDKQKSTLAKLAPYMGKYKAYSYLAAVLGVVSHVVALAPFFFLWLVLKELLGPCNGAVVMKWAWWALATGVLYLLLYFAALMLAHRSAFKVERNLKESAMQRVLKMPLGFFDSQDIGKLKNVIHDNALLVHSYLAHQLPDIAGASACLLALVVLMLGLDWRMGLLCLVPFAVVMALMASMMNNKVYRDSMGKYMNHLEEMNAEAVEYVRGIPVVKTFQQSVFSFNSFHRSIMEYSKYVQMYARESKVPMAIYVVASFGYAFLLIPFSIYLLIQGVPVAEVLSDLIFYLLVTPFFGECTMGLMYVLHGQRQATEAVDRIDALFEQTAVMEGSREWQPKGFGIELKEVGFRYSPEAKRAVDGVTLSIPEGKKVALVGASGSGKTTLARLIARFWEVEQGTIAIGGVDISKVHPEVLMREISFVFQSERLFKTTIRDNVTYGCPTATEEQVQRALERAQCLDIIAKLPHGLDTQIGAEGIYLSGGEQQRIILARAFLKDAPILLLDEATAFADPENEQAIQKVLAELMEGKTVLTIAHRLNSVVDADLIVVMQEGQIAEQGQHDELLARPSGLYASMWREYQESVEWRI